MQNLDGSTLVVAILYFFLIISCKEKEDDSLGDQDKNPIIFSEDSEHLITDMAEDAVDVFATDLDGDQDVLSASINDHKIAWYKNDGLGDFSPQIIISAQDYPARVVYASDLDQDGDQDVLAAFGEEEGNKIVWFRNDGLGNFEEELFITTNVMKTVKICVADLDGDNHPDVLSASFNDAKVAWYRNDGQGNFGEQQLIYQYISARSVYATDLDKDGDQDVLIATSSRSEEDRISWFSNDGSGTFGEEQFIVDQILGATDVFAIDLDGDNDQDVISAFWDENMIIVSLNLGEGSFSEKQIVTTQANVVNEIYTVDMNRDGYQDLISASWGDNKIAWYENDKKGNFGVQQIISTRANRATGVFAADLDQDGDQDILSASSRDDKIVWYENSLY